VLGGVPRASARPLPSSLSDALYSATDRLLRETALRLKVAVLLTGNLIIIHTPVTGKFSQEGKLTSLTRTRSYRPSLQYSCSLTV